MAGRDKNGRFIKGHSHSDGNKGGPGRPPKKREERYWQILATACSFKEWKEIVKTAVAQAASGDKDARKWLADYLVGSPTQRLELSGKDGGPLETVISLYEYGPDSEA